MAKFYYNGVLLPEIPNDIITDFPYCWINSESALIVAKNPWHYAGDMSTEIAGENRRYILFNDDWLLDVTYNDNGGYGVNGMPIWSSHDIPNKIDSIIYMYGSIPVSEDDVEFYLIDFSNSDWKTSDPNIFTVTDGDIPFFVDNTFPYNDSPTLRSGAISDNETTETTINFTLIENGSVEFNYTTSSENNYDKLFVYVDDSEVLNASGETSWTTFAKPVSSGNHTVKFSYQKDGSQGSGQDAVAIGYVKLIGAESAPKADKKYLIRCNGVLYAVSNGSLSQLSETILTSDVFRTNGIDNAPEWSAISSLVNPEVLCWQDSDELPSIKIDMTATPQNQIVTSNSISLVHESIKGIESSTATCTGTLSMAISTDEKATWKAHNGTEWLTLSDDYSGMSKEQLEAITVDQWNELIQGVDKIYIRIALTDTTQSVEEIVINFAN